MARLFDDGSSQYLSLGSAILIAPPVSFACWFRSDDLTINQTLVAIGENAVFGDLMALKLVGTVAGDPVELAYRGAVGDSVARTTAGYGANVWHHACGVRAAIDSGAVYIDSANKGTTVVNGGAPNALVRTAIGALWRDVPSDHVSGRIAEAAMWDIALTDEEAIILAAGYSPLFVRPQSLVAYWPLIGRLSPEIDPVGGFDMTLVNGPTHADHPRIIYPSAGQMRMIAAVSGLAWPIFSRQGIHSAVFGGQVIR